MATCHLVKFYIFMGGVTKERKKCKKKINKKTKELIEKKTKTKN